MNVGYHRHSVLYVIPTARARHADRCAQYDCLPTAVGLHLLHGIHTAFGGDQGLLAAALDVDLQLPKVSGWPREGVGELLARQFVTRWEGALSDEFITLLLRSASTNPAAAEQLRRMFAHQVLTLVEELVGEDPYVRR